MIHKLVVMALASLAIVSSAIAQPQYGTSGREFYIGFASNGGINETGVTAEISLWIMSDTKAQVHIDVPGLPFFQNVMTTPGSATLVYLPSASGGIGPTTEIDTAGIVMKARAVHLVTDHDITVIGFNYKQYTTAAFTAYPLYAYGTSYRAVCFPNSVVQNGPPSFPSEFLIDATQDSSHITITPTSRTSAGQPAGAPFHINMDKGDEYLVQSDVLDSTGDLTGSLITSDQPIAVYSGHTRTEAPTGYLAPDGSTSRNHIIQQLLPSELWETSAAIVPLASEPGWGLARIVAGSDNTTVTLFQGSDSAHHLLAKAGDFYQIDSVTSAVFGVASHPAEFVQFIHTGTVTAGLTANGDPAMINSPSLAHRGTSIGIVGRIDPSFPDAFATIILPAADSTIFVDGQLIPLLNCAPIPATALQYGNIRMTNGEHIVSAKDSFAIMTYGYGPVDSYAYSGGLVSGPPFDAVAAIHSESPSAVQLYPNPANRRLHSTGRGGIKLIDMLGRTVRSCVECEDIDVEGLPAGVFSVGGTRVVVRH